MLNLYILNAPFFYHFVLSHAESPIPGQVGTAALRRTDETAGVVVSLTAGNCSSFS